MSGVYADSGTARDRLTACGDPLHARSLKAGFAGDCTAMQKCGVSSKFLNLNMREVYWWENKAASGL